MLSVEEALERLLADARPVAESARVRTELALGRVLAGDLVSKVDVPPWTVSAMDGYAVRLADLAGDLPARLPVSQRIAAGSVGAPLQPGSAARIFTGAPVPAGVDAVVMQEECEAQGNEVLIRYRPAAGEFLRPRGEDLSAGKVVLPRGCRLRPQELGQAASAGHPTVRVWRRPRVALFFTGSEIVMPGRKLGPGQIYNSNRYLLNGLVRGLGCEVRDHGIVPDSRQATIATLARAAESVDLVVTSGGVSVGEEDHVRAAVESLGSLGVTQVAAKPGKPMVYGRVGEAAFLGLPGNPVSTLVSFCLFVRPYLLRLMGDEDPFPLSYSVEAAFDWPRPDKRREFLRGRLERGPRGAQSVKLFPNQSSGVLTSAAWADGLVDIPANTPVERGQPVRFIPFSEVLG